MAATNLDIFNRHADKVAMINIAQMMNVLQAMILTSKEKMLRTPTYWVYEMFKVHQGGTSLPIELTAPDYAFGQKKIPMVSASATRAADKSAVHVSLVNTSPSQPVTVSARLTGVSPKAVTGRILDGRRPSTRTTRSPRLTRSSRSRSAARRSRAAASRSHCRQRRWSS